MSDYVHSNPWGDAANAVGGMSDPVMQMFYRMPQMRAELAITAQRLAMQQREEDRLNRQLDAQIPHIQAQTGEAIARTNELNSQGLNWDARTKLTQSNQNAADIATRLATLQGLPEGQFATEALNSQSLGPDLAASGVGSVDWDRSNLSDIGAMISAALGAQRERVALGSPTAAASMATPYNTPSGTQNRFGEMSTPPPPFTLPAGAGRFTPTGQPIATQPGTAGSLSPYNRIVIAAAQAAGRGTEDAPQDPKAVENILRMTNMLDRAQSPQPLGSPTQPPSAATTQPGQIYNGYRYKGGDKRNPANWEKVQ